MLTVGIACPVAKLMAEINDFDMFKDIPSHLKRVPIRLTNERIAGMASLPPV
jgi:hypothetical protein